MNTRKLTLAALLLASDVLLTRVLAFNTPLMKIGLGFAAVAICACLYGAPWAALVAALGDILGSVLFPTGAYFPGFTLYGGRKHWVRPVLAAVLNCVLISYLANSAMIAFITGNSYRSMLAARAVQLTVMLPLQILVLLWLSRSGFIQRLIEHAQK